MIDFDGDDETSDTGFAAEVGLGKEWWVGNKWGLGASFTAGYHSIPSGRRERQLQGHELPPEVHGHDELRPG